MEIPPEVMDRIAQVCQRKGMTQLAVSSKVVEWFARQPDLVQSAILRNFPAKASGEVARLVMQHMAGELKSG
jgi:hypothetical protein